jgi:hypothetical protein
MATDHLVFIMPLLAADPPEIIELTIDEGDRRIETGGSPQLSPTIHEFQMAGHRGLVASCSDCRRKAFIPLESIRRTGDTTIADLLPSLTCKTCGQKGPPCVSIQGMDK